MLIEKKIALQDVVSFRLVSGEEMIGKMVDMDDHSITVSKPIVVQMQMISATQAGLGFAPFMSTADEDTTKYRFDRSKLICDPIKPRSDIKNQYIKATSNIEIVEKASGLIV